jgi:hypothetical protein
MFNSCLKTIAFFVIALFIALLLFPGCRRYLNGWIHETTYYYPDNAVMSAEMDTFLSPILPPSAHEIHEKFNSDYNTSVYSFKFSPSECDKLISLFDILETGKQELPKFPSWALPERWLPSYVRLGQVDKLSSRGYILYTSKYPVYKNVLYSTNRNRLIWYAAVNCSSGEAYAWNIILENGDTH